MVGDVESGPGATERAAVTARSRVAAARAVVLVEGISDQVAVESAAIVSGRDLAGDGVVVLPIGGAHAIERALHDLGTHGRDLSVAVLCDAGEERVVRRAIARLDDGSVHRIPIVVCNRDLEDELLRAAGRELTEQVMAAQGDRASFATLRSQPAWRDAAFHDQAWRFFGAGARRKARYADALVRALGPDRMPRPLADVLARVAR